MIDNIKYIAFDADDTLWVNEPYFHETEKEFCHLMSDYLSVSEISKELYKTEMQNLEPYGYGVKAFILSMIETALHISDHKLPPATLQKIVDLGKGMLNKPIELLDGIEDVLNQLAPNYKLIVATKGDLLDQERKLRKSGLLDYFHHVEVMTDKQVENYVSLLKHLEIGADQFVMIGNSLKSDILPVLELGGYGIHVPFHTMWQYEVVSHSPVNSDHFFQIDKISDIMRIIH